VIGSLSIFVFSTLVTLIYVVVFAYVYPNTSIDGSLVLLFALLGTATCLMVVGVWRLFRRSTPRNNSRRLANGRSRRR
jgi:hypothetical protein